MHHPFFLILSYVCTGLCKRTIHNRMDHMYHMYVHTHACVYVCECMYTRTHTHARTQTHTHTHTHTPLYLRHTCAHWRPYLWMCAIYFLLSRILLRIGCSRQTFLPHSTEFYYSCPIQSHWKLWPRKQWQTKEHVHVLKDRLHTHTH